MPTCPVPTPSRERAGFTLVEVLVAVTVATLILTVACSTLIVCLKSEEMSAHIEKMRPPLSIMQTRALLGMDLDATAQKLLPTWDVGRTYGAESIPQGAAWNSWTISPLSEPSLRVRFALATDQALKR